MTARSELRMTAHTRLRMTADEFIPWAMNQPKRYELASGEVVAMSPERAGHARAKALAWRSLSDALRERALPCEAFSDGMSVRVDTRTVYEPDALVRCGEPVDDAAVQINDPIIVVEVVSPSSRSVDVGAKLDDYFRLPSVRHYLIVKVKNRTSSITSAMATAASRRASLNPERWCSIRRVWPSRSGA